jgi:hypothetical protein
VRVRRVVERVTPLDQSRATKLRDELQRLHGELDQVGRDGRDSGARVSLLAQGSSDWAYAVLVAFGAGLVMLAFWAFQHFFPPPKRG